MERHRYLPLMLSAALLAAAGGSAVALGSNQDDDARPAREEIASLSADASISDARAERELRNQRRLPALAEAARRNLGRDYGGVWVAAQTRRITLGAVA